MRTILIMITFCAIAIMILTITFCLLFEMHPNNPDFRYLLGIERIIAIPLLAISGTIGAWYAKRTKQG